MLKKAIKPGVVALLAVVLFVSSFGVVQPGYVGVSMTLGCISKNVKEEGLYVKAPFIQSVKRMDVRTKKIEWTKPEDTISAMSKDMLDVYVQAVVTYHPVADKGAAIYKKLGTDYGETVVAPLTVDVIKTYFAKYYVADIMQNREKIIRDINTNLKEMLSELNITLDFVSLVNVDFRPELKTAIEQSQIASKQVETQKYTLEKQALEAQQQVKKAEADKQAKILAAQAEEEYNKKVGASLSDELLRYKALESQDKAIDKWNGSYPQVVAGGQSIPMIQLPQQSQKEKQADNNP